MTQRYCRILRAVGLHYWPRCCTPKHTRETSITSPDSELMFRLVSATKHHNVSCNFNASVVRALLSRTTTNINPLIMGTLKLQSNRRLCSNTVIGRSYNGRWWVGCYIVYNEEEPGRVRPIHSPPHCTKYRPSPRINGQCTNFILFDVAL